jgi:hypothetical protein
MNNLGIALVKLMALAGGAAVGALLSRWYDEVMTTRAEKRSQQDKMRYEQGLPAVGEQGQRQGQQPLR